LLPNFGKKREYPLIQRGGREARFSKDGDTKLELEKRLGDGRAAIRGAVIHRISDQSSPIFKSPFQYALPFEKSPLSIRLLFGKAMAAKKFPGPGILHPFALAFPPQRQQADPSLNTRRVRMRFKHALAFSLSAVLLAGAW
jgi:hypothetical protein